MSVDKGQRAPLLPPLNEEDAVFAAWSWRSDGKRLAGWRILKDGREAGIVVYSFESEKFESVTDFGRSPIWLNDNRRLIFWDRSWKLFLVDSETKQVRELNNPLPNAHIASISPDNKHVLTSLRSQEADLWLLTLNEER